MSGAWSFRESGDGIRALVLDVPQTRLNILSTAAFRDLAGAVAEAASRPPKGLMIVSGKPDNFVAGADVKEFDSFKTAAEGEAASRAAQEVFGRIASLPFPTLALLHGPSLGGGLELALACTYRIATDAPGTEIAAPEVQLGLLPGAGGCNRLPRLVGMRAALDLMLTGRRVDGKRAHRMGLVDALVPAEGREEFARVAFLRFLAGEKPRTRPRGAVSFLVERNPLGRALVVSMARREVMDRTKGLFPAPLAILGVAGSAPSRPLPDGLREEASAFGKLLVSPESAALRHLFFATTDAKKDLGPAAGAKPRPVAEVGILGAGLMGSGIAATLSDKGVPVRIRDLAAPALSRARKAAFDHVSQRVKRKRQRPFEADAAMARFTSTTDWRGFGLCDVVIEAVFEELSVKHQVLKEFEAATPGTAIFATNTSALPIERIAAGAARPGRVVGMHFFSPVQKMPLVEVVAWKGADPDAVATVASLARKMGKTVIVVNDGPGFYVNRPLSAYVTASLALLREGAAVDAIDRVMREAGFPVGPLQVLDEVGWDVARHVSGVLEEAFGARFRSPVEATRAHDPARLGRKSGRGFYLYAGQGTGEKPVDPSIYDALPDGRSRKPFDPKEIRARLFGAFLAEAERCLADGVVRSERDGDIGAVFGLGFPAHLGGPFHARRSGLIPSA